MIRTSALLRSRAAIQDARELRQEVKQYGLRQPKPLTLTIVTRRNGVVIKRTEYK